MGEELADPGPPDEREDKVDPVRGVDLGLDFAANGRLVAGVGHQDRVSQRSERPPDWDRLVSGGERLDGGQALDRGNQGAAGCNCVGVEASYRGEDRSGQVDSGLGPLVGGDCCQDLVSPAAKDLAESIGKLRRVDVVDIRSQALMSERVKSLTE
ncbi:MAG: hypothetical protein GY708_19685 [Actinomycetia bacterium]|nr:hypothetical protein [Actinomycetes bacterium]MCP3937581.1 hypothetical protein [Actinomycetes bacterium]